MLSGLTVGMSFNLVDNYVSVLSVSPSPTSHLLSRFCGKGAGGKAQPQGWTSHSCPVFDPKPWCWSLGTAKQQPFSKLGWVKADVRSLPSPRHPTRGNTTMLP